MVRLFGGGEGGRVSLMNVGGGEVAMLKEKLKRRSTTTCVAATIGVQSAAGRRGEGGSRWSSRLWGGKEREGK